MAENVNRVKEYELHLDRMLDLCDIPLVLEKSSESLIHEDVIEQYFTLLGHLLVILPTKKQALKVHKALHSLLLKKQKEDISAIQLEHCHKAVEKSKLPLTVVELLQASTTETYPKTLELVLLLSSISYKCCMY